VQLPFRERTVRVVDAKTKNDAAAIAAARKVLDGESPIYR
jgi:hypothetical protein